LGELDTGIYSKGWQIIFAAGVKTRRPRSGFAYLRKLINGFKWGELLADTLVWGEVRTFENGASLAE